MPKIVLYPEKYIFPNYLQEEIVYTTQEKIFTNETEVLGISLAVSLIAYGKQVTAVIRKLTDNCQKASDLLYDIEKKQLITPNNPFIHESYGNDCLFIMVDRTKYLDLCWYSDNPRKCSVDYDEEKDNYIIVYE